MCSVIGYIGKNYSREYVIEGLSVLEYRGYDSAGFACIDPDSQRLVYRKTKGKLSQLKKQCEANPIDGFVGIGHTRWATHGAATEANAHPHFDCQKTLAIVHNGIIENHHQLRNQLEKAGHIFHSHTDSEVIAHLLEDILSSSISLKESLICLANQLEGAYAFVGILQEQPDLMILVRRRSPLCIGVGEHELFAASDLLAFADKTKKVIFMPDASFAILTKDSIELYDFSGKPIALDIQEVATQWIPDQKKDYDHFMLKEIYDQKGSIYASVRFYQSLKNKLWDYLDMTPQDIKELESINLIAAGTPWNAARIAQFFFETVCQIPTYVSLASEFRYMPFFPKKHSVYIMVSQSGETADTLEALRRINESGLRTVAITNVPSSTMVREANGFLLTQAGPEIGVAATKTFTTQLAALYWLAHSIALKKEKISKNQMEEAEENLLIAAQVLESTIENYKQSILYTYAAEYARFDRFIFLGRHIVYPFALEAALKLKEISYIFAQCYPAGELKHGPIALVDNRTPIFLFSHPEPLIYQKLLGNAHEVKSRGGHLIAFVFEGQKELEGLADVPFIIPKVHPLLAPLAMAGLMQFFVYSIAKELDCSIDKPRNLAKSVTVE